MSNVKLVLGPARGGKSTLLVRDYVQFLDDWRRDCRQSGAIWIGPSHATLEQVRDQIASRTVSALLNPQVATFAKFAEQVIAQSGRRIRPIGTWDKLRILQQLVADLAAKKKLGYYSAAAETTGFIQQVAQFIGELKRRDIWAEQFRQRARSDRDRNLGAIYSAYQQFLIAQDLYDAEGRFWAARDEMQKETDTKWGLVVVDGFTDFTSAQHDILRLLAERSDRLLISLLGEEGETSPTSGRGLLFGRTNDTRTQLLQSMPSVESEFVGPSRFDSPALAHLERQLFRDDQTTANQATGISILAANSVQGEIQEIARRIKMLLFTSEAQPEEIAVVFRNLDEVAPRIAQVCEDFGLPFDLENHRKLKDTPQVRSLVKLLRLHEQDWPFDLLLDLVGNRSTGWITDGSTNDWRLTVERCIRRAQLPAGRTLLLDQVRLWASADDEKSKLSPDVKVALPILESLEQKLAILPLRAPLAEWIDHLEQLVESFGIAEPHWPKLRRALITTSSRDEQLGVASEELTSAQVMRLVELVSSEVPLPAKHDAAGRVRFFSAANARNLEVRHLFLAGLSEQAYSNAESATRLYNQQELGHFSAETNSRTPTSEEQAGDAMLLFYEMVTRSSKSLTLSYPALDEKGQALSPSPFLTELERCFSDNSIPKMEMPLGMFANKGQIPVSRSDWRIGAVEAALDGEPKWLAGLVSQNVGAAILQGVHSVGSRSQRDTFGPYEGMLASEAVRAALGKRFNEEYNWSPSSLEKYATCPFQFFAGKLLGLEPLEEITLRSDHLRRGSLLHQVLAAVHQQAGGLDDDLSEAELVTRFAAALERLIAETPLSGLNDALRELDRRVVLSWAPQYAEQELQYRKQWHSFDEPLRPTHFEVSFGPLRRDKGDEFRDPLSQSVPFSLDLGNEQIRLTGQIDRIDVGQVRGVTVFTIIDYKSGQGVTLKPAEMEAGRQLQLPLYAIAAEKLLLADQQAVPLATGYWNIKKKGFGGARDALQLHRTTESGLEATEGWDALQSAIFSRIEEVVQGVRAGDFPVYNEDKRCTETCDFSKICRIAQIRSLEKVWNPGEQG